MSPDSEPPTIPMTVAPTKRLQRTASGTNIQADAVLRLLAEKVRGMTEKK